MSQVIERTFKAPIALVWELWTTPEGRASWFGPRGFEVLVHELTPEVGGKFTYTMKGRGREFTVTATFTEVQEFTRLAWTAPAGPGGDTLTTGVTFSETADGVHMRLTLEATQEGMTQGAAMGWDSSLDRFEERLAG